MLRTNKNTILKLFYLEGSYTELATDDGTRSTGLYLTLQHRPIYSEQYSNLGPQTNILFRSLLCKDCNSLNAIKQVATSRPRTKQFLNISVQLSP